MTTNRAMIVTILHRLERESRPLTDAGFDDVAQNQWYTEAVSWANENGVVTGYDNGKFGPMDQITREQLAAILYRYAEYKGYDVHGWKPIEIERFADSFVKDVLRMPQITCWEEEGKIQSRHYIGKLAGEQNSVRARLI